MSEDRVWLDSTGRPVSDQVRVTERFQRVDYDTLVWSETIEDPRQYTKPWETLRLMRLHDPRTDIQSITTFAFGAGELQQAVRQHSGW